MEISRKTIAVMSCRLPIVTLLIREMRRPALIIAQCGRYLDPREPTDPSADVAGVSSVVVCLRSRRRGSDGRETEREDKVGAVNLLSNDRLVNKARFLVGVYEQV